MNQLSIQQFAVPLIEALDQHNFMLESHHRRAAVICYHLGIELELDDEEMFSLIVAALFHNIGALTVLEKENILNQVHILAPHRHCMTGAAILPSNAMFKDVAKIIRCHHINYKDAVTIPADEVMFASHILHLVDRVNVLIPDDAYVVNQGGRIILALRENVGSIFHPQIFQAFERIVVRESFWAEIQDLEIGVLLDRLELSKAYTFNIDDVVEFAAFVSKVIDYRSQYTLNHSYIVAHLADLLGGYFGVSKDDRKKLMIAGYLHDMGYLCIDPRIIEKRGILTSTEANLIKRHVFFTEKMLRSFKKLKWFAEILVWCERHHERSDGTGYPFSLTGDSLDLGTKILAYADTISALMGKRAHHSGLNIDTVFDILRNDVATSLSLVMFTKLEQHKIEINQLVKSCQAEVAQDLELIASQID